jgi:excisionase family DNA binding protein
VVNSPARQIRPNLTVHDVADLCGVSVRTVQRWAGEGGIPCYRLGGNNGALRFDADEVQVWLRRSAVTANEPRCSDGGEASEWDLQSKLLLHASRHR